MDRFEEAVLQYVSANPDTLIKSQLHLPYNKEEKTGGSLPDFVVLNFKEKCLYIIEVTTAADTRGILNKISERETRWYKPVLAYNAEWAKLVTGWEFRVCLFVRPQLAEKLAEQLSPHNDVSVKSLSETMNPWEWCFDKSNTPSNPLR